MKLLAFTIGLILILSSGFKANAQEKVPVLLTGKVMDTLYNQGFYNLMVVNRTTGRGVFGQPDGTFSVYASEGDSITLSTKGYPMYGFRIQSDSNHQMRVLCVLENKVYQQKEVEVRPLKSLQQIKEERANLSLRETRNVTGMAVINSPITALYERFSEKEQRKAMIAKLEYKDNQVKVLKELLRLYVVYDIVNLSEEEFGDFIQFLNIDETFLKTASEMELATFIKDKFEHYVRMK